MKPLTILLIIVLASTLPDHLQADPPTIPKESFWWDPFQMGRLNSTASVNLCVRNISGLAQMMCGLDPTRYKQCCPGNATDCLKQFSCGDLEGAADYFDALFEIGAAFPTCQPDAICRRFARNEELTLKFCLGFDEDVLRLCPHMNSTKPEVKCRGQNETLACFRKAVTSCGSEAEVVTRFLEAVAKADYHRYCRSYRDETKPDETTDGATDDNKDGATSGGKGHWGKWLLVLGAVAVALFVVAVAVVVLCVLWKRKQGDNSQTEAPSTVSNKPSGSKGAKVSGKVGPQGQSEIFSSESVTFDSILSSKPISKSAAKMSQVDSKLDSKSGQTPSSTKLLKPAKKK